MATFHNFNPENCIGRKLRLIKRESYGGTEIGRVEGIVTEADEDCLYFNNGYYCTMKDLELGNESIEWLTQDEILYCADCNNMFVLKGGEIDFYNKKRLHKPKRCKSCRGKRRESRNNMYIVTIKGGLFGTEPDIIYYLGWQNPAWDEDGYFWTSKDAIFKILKEGNNTKEHPFLFETQVKANWFAKNMDITDYSIEKWYT